MEKQTRPAPAATRLPLTTAMLAGVLALASALAAGHLVAAFVGINASPYLAVGNSAIDLTPSWLKDFAVRAFGNYDKLVLLAGMAIVMAILAVAAGALSRRTPLPGTAVILGLGLIAAVAVATRPDRIALGLLTPLASLTAGLVIFHVLYRAASHHRNAGSGEPDTGHTRNRRLFLLAAGSVAVGAGLAAVGGESFASSRSAAGSRGARQALVAARPAPPIPTGADFAALGTPSFLTRNAEFYRVDTALAVPRVSADDWTLRLHGMVNRVVEFNYSDIQSRPLVERTITMTCVSNEIGGHYLSTASFLGVELRDLLAEAGVRPGAEQVFSTSIDGYTAGTPIETVLDPHRGAMLAIAMNGEPLLPEHGFPARMVVPGLYGYASATKWVTDLDVTTWSARRPYWVQRGWARHAPIKTQSRIDTPKGFQTLTAGPVTAAGIAWAQTTGIDRVEVRLDNGPWLASGLSIAVNDNTWRMWRVVLDVPAGTHQLTCRATDRSGYIQTPDRAGTVPDGATGWHTLSFTAR